MLGESCPVATPTIEDSSMSLNEQSDTFLQNQNPIQPDSTPMEDVIRGDHSEESSALDSDTVSESGSCPDSGSHNGSGSGSVE